VGEKAKEDNGDEEKEEEEWRRLYVEMKSALIFKRFHCIFSSCIYV
jgi:hypothetical protein